LILDADRMPALPEKSRLPTELGLEILDVAEWKPAARGEKPRSSGVRNTRWRG
jgi:hypothetical protein